MATETLDISGVGADDEWGLAGAATKAIALSDASDGTRLNGDPNQRQDVLFTDPATIDANDSISNVTITVRCQDVGIMSDTLNYVVSDGTNTSSGTITGITTSITNKTISLDESPTGGAWTLAQLQSLALEIHAPNNAGQAWRWQKCSALVTYTAVANSKARGGIVMGIGVG